MKKILFSLILTFSWATLFGQKYMTQNGEISFYSKAPLEDIEATNNQVSSIINFESGQVVFSLLMKAFTFEKALMQEHFNEKYVHSDKYPKAQFKGKVVNQGIIDLSKPGTYKAAVKGDLTIHGVTQPVETDMTFTVSDSIVKGVAAFDVLLADYDVEIPKVVKDNIAESVSLSISANYRPYGK